MGLEQVRHVRPSTPPLSSLKNGHCPMGQQLPFIPQDNINDEEAASAAAMTRVTGARSDETQSDIGAEPEQQPIHRDEEGYTSSKRLYPAGGGQGSADTREPSEHSSHRRESWTHARASFASAFQRRWSATFDLKMVVRRLSLS